MKRLFSLFGFAIFIATLGLSVISAPTAKADEGIQADYGVTDINKIEDAISEVRWEDASRIRVIFKNSKELLFRPSGVEGSDYSRIWDERLTYSDDFGPDSWDESGAAVNYTVADGTFGCDARVTFDIDENKGFFDKQSTILAKDATVDIDFRPNADSDCKNGNAPKINPTQADKSIAYFQRFDGDTIGFVANDLDSQYPGIFTRGTTTFAMDGVTYSIFLSTSSTEVDKECQNKLAVDEAGNSVLFYDLGDSDHHDGDPPSGLGSECKYSNDESDNGSPQKNSLPRNAYAWPLANTEAAAVANPIDVDAGRLEAGYWHARGRQWAQQRRIEFGKGTGAVAGQFLERSLVQIHQQCGNGPVQGGNTEEGLVAQAGQNPALYHLHPHFDLGLVTWFGRARRHDRQAVMHRELFQQTV